MSDDCEELNKQVKLLKNEVDFWRKAWHEQRVVTGKSYWDGYRWGFKVAQKLIDNIPYIGKSK